MASVLVVDDEESIRFSFERTLTRAGNQVIVAEHSNVAKAILAANEFDVAVIDRILAGGETGLELIKFIKEMQPSCETILVSGYPTFRSAAETLKLETFAYLNKPVKREELCRAVKDAALKRRAKMESVHYEEIFRSLFDASPDGIVVCDLSDNVRFINPSFTRIFGYEKEEVIGNPLPNIPDRDREKEMSELDDLLKGKSVPERETQRPTKDGRSIDVAVSRSVFMDNTGKPSDILIVLRDITGKKKIEKQFFHAQKMESVALLAGGIAHDFNNLLMSIQGSASIMLMNKDASHPDFKHLTRIENHIEKAAHLAGQLLGFARGGKYEIRATDLNELIKNQNRMFDRTRKEITIHEKYHEDPWSVEVDRGQIEQVLLNLYVNAGQAMPGGGDLYLETEKVILDEDDVKPFSVKPGRYMKISVTDTGVGMDKATLERIFEPFFTTKKVGGGTGLGLSSAYGIIKNHDGFINVYSEKGHGTTFNVYLPASEKAVAKEKKLMGDPLRGTETILFIDDEDMITEFAEELLKKLGYKVLIANSGKEAVQKYEENKDRISIVVLDMIMPDMGGGETFNILKKINPEVKVLLSSGYSIDGQAAGIMDRGCNGFIQKPFKIKELSEKLREILDKE